MHLILNQSNLIINFKSEIMPQPHIFHKTDQLDIAFIPNQITRKTSYPIKSIELE